MSDHFSGEVHRAANAIVAAAKAGDDMLAHYRIGALVGIVEANVHGVEAWWDVTVSEHTYSPSFQVCPHLQLWARDDDVTYRFTAECAECGPVEYVRPPIPVGHRGMQAGTVLTGLIGSRVECGECGDEWVDGHVCAEQRGSK